MLRDRKKTVLAAVTSGAQRDILSSLAQKAIDGTSCDALVSHHRRSLSKALVCAISLEEYGPGTGSHVYGSEGSLLPY